MTGTEKQIKWAEDIKQNAYQNIALIKDSCYGRNVLTGERVYVGYFDISAEAIELVEKQYLGNMEKVTEASKIIDMRYKLSYDALRQKVKDVTSFLKNNSN